MKVYLCGGINGLSDADAKVWRAHATAFLLVHGHSVIDPMARDYRGIELENVADIVHGDLADISSSEALLVMAERPSWGTAMEIRQAFVDQKKIVVVCSADRPSPWLVYHSSSMHRTLEEALACFI